MKAWLRVKQRHVLRLNPDTYQIRLPPNLPPSHSGKVCRIAYKLLIGVQKDALQRKTKVISIPFRLFNRTEQDGTRSVYEVLQPAVTTRDEAITAIITGETPSSSPLFRTII
jgi:Rgp1